MRNKPQKESYFKGDTVDFLFSGGAMRLCHLVSIDKNKC